MQISKAQTDVVALVRNVTFNIAIGVLGVVSAATGGAGLAVASIASAAAAGGLALPRVPGQAVVSDGPRLPRRQLFGVAGIAAAVWAAGSCGEPDREIDPPEPSPSRDPALLVDDIADGISVENLGSSTFPAPDGDAAHRIVGAAAVFRNLTEQPMDIHIRYQFVDEAGRGRHSEELNDWAAIISTGWAYLPPGRAVEFGDGQLFAAAEASRVARIVMRVLAQPATPSVLLAAKVDKLIRRATPASGFDYVSFEVDNQEFPFEEPHYSLVFKTADGGLTDGWFIDRSHWVDIGKALPEGETDRYPRGVSRHTLPVILPPDARPDHVAMHLWK
ncbi:hypothetical protein [Actinoplanes couchii]|uniref:Uncharacterized protein n=1 Tax=Actinoplanes couchii TaxID=403638 RepID=A0ABQ3XD39_9ACTN|nr:hypothetical protein [Actinoplanes couchii]MDR6321202.1 hypothetical protein [Actinoplanes couchii]GID56310.1 hypothetical protein Aco03nite_047140 [Actinoplanes couchii]